MRDPEIILSTLFRGWERSQRHLVHAIAYLSKELVSAFESTWTMIARALDRWTIVDLGRVFPPPLSLSEADREAFGEERTLHWIVWHVHEHELHHGGELSLALGSLDVQGSMTTHRTLYS